VNEAACAELGYSREELLRLCISDINPIITADQWGGHWEELRGKGSLRFETQHRTKSGDLHDVEVVANHIVFEGQEFNCATVRDITERKRVEEERRQFEQKLQHTQKLESLGVLAGGIAHDFNNILTSIIGNTDLALMRANPESPVVENLRRIETSASRAADLARQMLAYSGKGRFVVAEIDLNNLIEEMVHMLEVSISKKSHLRLNLSKSLRTIKADATQMHQVVMNLVINASEAIGDREGVISITTGCMNCDRRYLGNVWLDDHLEEGAYVYFEISDSGCGMDKETQSKIFDPFFTTKFTGRGLGMAAVMGIIRGHRGAIKIYSEVGQGTTFKVLFPASSELAVNADAGLPEHTWRSSGKALLVDDEETVRTIGTDMLRELGFQVLTASDGRQALELFNCHPDISFVLLDLTMPVLDGEQTFRELRNINPDVKVIMTSGYNEQDVTQKFVGKGLAGFVQKPYKLSALRETIVKMGI
jgi:PAS domain S-box-containing protein